MKTIKNILRVSHREWHIFLCNPIYLVCMVLSPLVVTLFFTTLMNDGQPTEMPVGIVDLDNTTTTRKLTRTLDSFQSSKVVAHYASVEAARRAVQQGKIYAFMYFPKGTTDDLLASRQPKVSFYYSSTSITAGALLFKDLKTMCTLANASVGQATMQAKGYSSQEIMAYLQPFVVESHNIGNPWISYNIYLSTMLIPGCLLLFVLLVTAYSFGAELKFNTNKDLMRVAGNNLFAAVVGKLLPQTVIFTGIIWVALTYMFGILHFPAPGGMFNLYALSFFAVIGSQGFAMLIFSMVPSMRLSISICSLWAVLSFSMAGSAFPVIAMDKPLELLSWLFPLRHYYVTYQLCVFNPYPLTDAWGHIVALVCFTIIPWLFYKRLGYALRNYVYTA